MFDCDRVSWSKDIDLLNIISVVRSVGYYFLWISFNLTYLAEYITSKVK